MTLIEELNMLREVFESAKYEGKDSFTHTEVIDILDTIIKQISSKLYLEFEEVDVDNLPTEEVVAYNQNSHKSLTGTLKPLQDGQPYCTSTAGLLYGVTHFARLPKGGKG